MTTPKTAEDVVQLRPLLIGNDFPPEIGGIQQYVAALAERLPDVAVVAGATEDASGDTMLTYPVHRGRRGFLLPTRATARFVQACAFQHHANVAVFTAPFPLPPVGRRLDIPFAVICHGAELVWPAATPGLSAVYRRWLRRASCLFTVSRYTAGHLRTLVGPDGPPIRFARPGVDVSLFRPAPPADRTCASPAVDGTQGPLIVSVGRLVPRKGTDVLLRALPLVSTAVADVRVLVVGDGRWRPRLERLARRVVSAAQLNSEAVTFVGRTAPDHLPAIYTKADVAAMPGRTRWRGLEQEGFGMVFVEAQACGVPVIAGRSGGAPETVIDGETGIVVDGTDVDAVAGALIDLLTDTRRRAEMGRAARAHVHRNFDWDQVAASMADDLSMIASGRTPPTDY